MPVNFGDFADKSTLDDDDFLVGYDTGTPNVEKRWSYANLKTELGTDLAGTLGGDGVAKAWVTIYSFAYKGTSTVSRTVGTNTATITTSVAHGLTNGQQVYLALLAAGTLPENIYTINVLNATQFSVTTLNTTALNNVSIGIYVLIDGTSSYNVDSVTINGEGEYTINFTPGTFTNNRYCVVGTAHHMTQTTGGIQAICVGLTEDEVPTTSSVKITTSGVSGSLAFTPLESDSVNIAVFGN